MKKERPTLITIFLISYCLSGLMLVSCSSNTAKEEIIITRIHGTFDNINSVSGDKWRFPEQAQIVSIGKGKNGSEPKILTAGFYSAAYPDVSYDGKFILFTGQLKKDDPWRIWELNLRNLKARAVTPDEGKSADPVYLPGSRLAYSRSAGNDSLKAISSLFTCNLDGTDSRRITFNPCASFASSVLKDGRILTANRQIFPDTGRHESIVMRPDGTKAELFYLPGRSSSICSRQRETSDGKVVFAESMTGNGSDGSLISLNYSRPLHTRKNLSTGITGNFISVFPVTPEKMLVCYRKSQSGNYSLYEFDPQSCKLGELLFENQDYNVIDVVIAGKHERPRKLPSEVDMHVKTGLLLCQDINVLNPLESGKNRKKAFAIEILGLDRSLGIVKAEEDGSFYLKPLSDIPFRLQAIDEDGKAVGAPCDWIYLRPNERRGCVGCHEDPELSPENRIPLSVRKNPVIVPVHIDKIKEKKVDLE